MIFPDDRGGPGNRLDAFHSSHDLLWWEGAEPGEDVTKSAISQVDTSNVDDSVRKGAVILDSIAS